MTNTPPIPPARLEVTEPEGKRYVVEITKSPFVIGRSTKAAASDLPLIYKRISRCPNCAVVTYTDGSFRLEDCGQKRGLLVNGQQITSHELQDGDTIDFGGFSDCPTLVFRFGPARDAEAPPPSVGDILQELERSRDLEPQARSLQQLGLILKATALLQSPRPLEEVLAKMVDHAIETTDADRGVLFQVEKGKPRATLARQRGGRSLPLDKVQASRTALKQALKRKKLVVEDAAQEALQEAASVAEQQLRSVVALPLLTLAQMRAGDTTFVPGPDDLLGVLYLDSRRPLAFAPLGREVLHGLATQAASVLDNARLVQIELERRRLEQELTIAREIQQALLPKDFKQYAHLQVTGINRSCLAVGGDYFDLMELEADRTA
ncbi:MAG: FHA domain-containing protein, partial [Candidatus Acidoferrales bacterium]